MTNLMIYLTLTGALVGAAALVIEHARVALGRPRRFVWLAAMVVSITLPAYSVLAQRIATGHAPDAAAAATEPATMVATAPSDRRSPAPEQSAAFALQLLDLLRQRSIDAWHDEQAPRLPELDSLLIVLWIASSTGVLGFYGLALVGLNRASRQWPSMTLEGGDVLVSERLGPAIFGFVRPRIVLPRWLLDAPNEERALVLRHEREHAAARDPLLHAAALLLVAFAPWNPVLWWQLSRLRASVELDCDARVVNGGVSTVVYSETLLAVSKRRIAAPLSAVALIEPVSRLEDRIRTLLRIPSTRRRTAMLASTPLAVAALMLAYALTPPPTLAQDAGATTVDPVTGMVIGGTRVAVLVDTSTSMLDREIVNILRRRNFSPDQRRASPKWQQVVITVERLAMQLAPGTQVQIIGFAEQATALIDGSNGGWPSATDGPTLDSAVQALRNAAPSGPTNLQAAVSALRSLQPPPDNVYVLVDGLPTRGEAEPSRAGITAGERADLFHQAVSGLPGGIPINVILFPMEGDPDAASLFRELAVRTGGVLFAAPVAETRGGDTSAAAANSVRNLVLPIDI